MAVSRQVSVVDTVAPVITLNGAATVHVGVGISYVDAGATATDKGEGDISVRIEVNNRVNVLRLGKYTVTYNLEDESGNNATQVIRTVTVRSCLHTVRSGRFPLVYGLRVLALTIVCPRSLSTSNCKSLWTV
mgnify:CR=1 FL=1